MLRVRERINSWPSFVDLFSNLVIILIFLLIVFVFLWTTTNVFGGKGSVAQIAQLKKVTAEQTQQITELKNNEQQANELLLAARDELLALDQQRTGLESQNSALSAEKASWENEKTQMTQDQTEMVAAYERKLYELQNQKEQMNTLVNNLQTALGQARESSANSAETVKRAAALQMEIERLNSALMASDQVRQQKDAEYTMLSERLNKALADKVAELNQASRYQSQFFRSMRDALADLGGVDVSSDRFTISSDILFPVGGFSLSPEGKRQIKIIAGVIKQMETKIPANVSWVIRVDGHTDRLAVNKNAKLYKNNLELSLLRARAVASELEKNGVSNRRLIPAGFGEKYPIVEGKTAKQLQKNRRIELRLTNP